CARSELGPGHYAMDYW
nr:immunoglobulin heavy chain junction region [Mus musculus]MBK4198066.1 immunoglobulin heavy chain junction region [Mus musculus]